MNISNILVVLDPTHVEQPILQRAARVAKGYGAGLTLFVAERKSALETSFTFDSLVVTEIKEKYQHQRIEWLEQQADLLRQPGLEVNCLYRWQSPLYSAINRVVEEQGVDLVMKATHHHSIIERALFTNTDWHLIRECPAPLWLVKEQFEWETHAQLLAAIDVALTKSDSNTLAYRILDFAQDLAGRLPSALHVLHAYEPIPIGMVASAMDSGDRYQSYRFKVQEEHQAALNAMLPDHVENNAKMHLEEGSADQVIETLVVQEGIDLVVMGASSGSRIDEWLVGSTAERTLEQIRCDVLIVK